MMITDTHTHLYAEQFDQDRDQVIEKEPGGGNLPSLKRSGWPEGQESGKGHPGEKKCHEQVHEDQLPAFPSTENDRHPAGTEGHLAPRDDVQSRVHDLGSKVLDGQIDAEEPECPGLPAKSLPDRGEPQCQQPGIDGSVLQSISPRGSEGGSVSSSLL